MAPILGIIGAVLPAISDIIGKAVEDKDLAKKIEAEVTMRMLQNAHQVEQAAAQIILAEAKSEHWLTASWRPILMLTITGIVAWNFLVGPLAGAILGLPITIPLPAELWTLLTVGVGGYVVGRSAEKVTDKLKG